ncbi:PTS transporter subunit IIC [Senegalia massiliensis]|uniref:PTS sugar transporter subunit IIC n=1 Tax=Senegalia massiliensis TaxID=1720316 RepID=A0A845QTB2_9CLOT|nr:PTS sugar transporter subunit IIC [Senegalia massiliensis]NBI05284.1 PTS sugar transporter subunit IIC [Senegalia massiliensis]
MSNTKKESEKINKVENKSKFKAFLERKNIEISFQRYLIDALSFMALGLFATLITGVIFRTVGERLGIDYFVDVIGPKAIAVSGPGIAVAVALGLKSPPLVLFASTINGFIGYELGGPVGAFLAAVVGAEFGKAVSKETPIDVVVTPMVTAIAGSLVGSLVGPGINEFMLALGAFVNRATLLQPIPMGIIVAAIMGITLTLPISSTAIAIMIAIAGPASGAAVVGGCAQSVGFGIQSIRENGWSGFITQALGSPMIQIGNIVKKPILLVPPTITGMILGPLVTTIFPMESISAAAGTGTSGLVAPLGALAAMSSAGTYSTAEIWIKIIVFCFIAPGVICWAISEVFRKLGWIKQGDLKLDLEKM